VQIYEQIIILPHFFSSFLRYFFFQQYYQSVTGQKKLIFFAFFCSKHAFILLNFSISVDFLPKKIRLFLHFVSDFGLRSPKYFWRDFGDPVGTEIVATFGVALQNC
jgi:hypothetical protein